MRPFVASLVKTIKVQKIGDDPQWEQLALDLSGAYSYISSYNEMRFMDRGTINIFRALDDSNRLRILKMLEGRELCVCEVREVLNLSTSTVSKHLTILRDAGLILDRKDGKWVNFRLNMAADGLVRPLLAVLKNGLTDEKQIAADREKVKHVDRTKLCGL
jgi:ArsR family transcriptional regulator, arsenate/arsenite/antimonite-responsive transcriptional repressor